MTSKPQNSILTIDNLYEQRQNMNVQSIWQMSYRSQKPFGYKNQQQIKPPYSEHDRQRKLCTNIKCRLRVLCCQNIQQPKTFYNQHFVYHWTIQFPPPSKSQFTFFQHSRSLTPYLLNLIHLESVLIVYLTFVRLGVTIKYSIESHLSFIRSHSEKWDNFDFFNTNTIHIT